MIVVSKPPRRITPVGITLFLGGSIEMGKVTDWQTDITRQLKKSEVSNIPITILNPRRDSWNKKWKQSIHNRHFANQVHWELDHISVSDIVILYFHPETLSPISLMELGICSVAKPNQTVVCAPEGFWRKGNIEVICNRNHIKLLDNIADLVKEIVVRISDLNKI